MAAGLLTAALAVAAHGVAGSGAPTGTAVVLLAVLATTVGALAATIARTADACVLLGLLATGQVVGHLMLSVAGHSHGASMSLAPDMLAGHALAVAAGALTDRGGRSALPQSIASHRGGQACRRSADTQQADGRHRRRRPTASFGPSARRVDVASGSAGQLRMLTCQSPDIKKATIECVSHPWRPSAPSSLLRARQLCCPSG
jgi:hypothetical protein